MKARCRLGEALATVSLATDMGAGQPQQTALGATVIATRVARALGLSESRVRDVFYATLVRFIGCTSTSADFAGFALGDDPSLFYTFSLCDWTDPEDTKQAAERWVAPNAEPEARRELIANIVAFIESDDPGVEYLHCAQARFLCSRLPLPDGAQTMLATAYPWWNGAYVYGGPGGDSSDPAERVIMASTFAENTRRIGGVPNALAFLNQRSGSMFDPAIVELIADRASEIFAGLDAPSVWDLALSHEPKPWIDMKEAEFGILARTFGDLVDQKSAFHQGHSPRVAKLAIAAAEHCGLAGDAIADLDRAAMLHDIGRMALVTGMLDKPQPLTASERVEFETHTFHTDRLLRLLAPYAPLARLASGAHERADGKGFHRGVRVRDTTQAILCAANAYADLTQDRAWRDALSPEDAADRMLAKVSVGKLAPRATDAVLQVAGQASRRAAKAYPDGLTRREVEVLGRLSQGLTTKEIARKLSISPKTADHHIQNIYRKTKARTRAEAALYALRESLFVS